MDLGFLLTPDMVWYIPRKIFCICVSLEHIFCKRRDARYFRNGRSNSKNIYLVKIYKIISIFSLAKCFFSWQTGKLTHVQIKTIVRNLTKVVYLHHSLNLYITSQKRLIASQLKPRKGRDIKWILIENIYSLFWGIFGMKRLYMFSISIHLINLPFRGSNCEAISLFWEGSCWRARLVFTFWFFW